MRLKSLEIKGFKSFADKTQILLDHPITGIVGPNGCGKSNIIDAIRWVIGEHKIKSLRSDNLDDLVFNGSRSRTASGMAEVSLTFENTRNLLPTEFTTVTITRKFYKSGESEYRLNDVACRLKDIHNLFLDTGVSNDSYAIIELGMVDDIIKDKEGSRRRMLEQAAGISIYKTRKKEAKLKLDATLQDIARIDDLLFEINNNLRTLESQARKAERYLQIKDDYKKISIEVAKASLEAFNDSYQALNRQLEIEHDKKLAIETEIAGDEAEIEQNKLSLTKSEQELNGLQKQYNELQNRIRGLEGEKKLAAQRLDHLQDREKSLNQFLTNANAQKDQFENSVTFTQEQIQQEIEASAELKDQLEDTHYALEEKKGQFDQQRSILEKQRADLQALQRRQFDAEKIVAVADSSVSNLQRSIQQLTDEKEGRGLQLKKLEAEKKETEELARDKQDELQDLIEKQEHVKAQILQGQEKLETLRSKYMEENRKLDARKNEHDLLKSLVENLEGYPDSIKFLKKNTEWSNTSPLLSDIFVVKEGYKTALENVLDHYLNYYVVDNIEQAIEAVQLLETHKKGKANFFILDRLGGPEKVAAQLPEGATPALSVLSTEPAYELLAQKLLGHVCIVEDLAALKQAQMTEGMVVIEKSGKAHRGPYRMGGGSLGLFEGNKIGRAKNLERLATEIRQLSEITGQIKQEISDTQSRLSAHSHELNDKSIEQCKNEIHKLYNQSSSLTHRIESLQSMDLSGEQRLRAFSEQLEETQDDISGAREDLDEANEALAALQEQSQTAAARFALVEADYNMAQQHYNHQNLQLTRQQSKIEGLKKELDFRQNQYQALLVQIEDNKAQLQTTSTQISETSGKLHFGDNELYELLIKKEADEKILNEKDKAYYALRNAISEHEHKISRQRKEKENAELLLNQIKEKLSEMKLQVAGIKERLKVEFRVELEAILEEKRETDMSLDELNAEGDRLKKRLENIGEINPTAIEAYAEIKVRYDFIMEQKADLVDAHDTLLATISEVEMTANTKFKETFDAIRTNFQAVFKALFTEDDTADLKLTDPDNIAESGIEIYAQPKGKRPSTLTQLSGGEKTLTSTAFLFAIYLIKPAPFCILDEVDAPLDDANVGKFTQMIRKFSDNSQFIIVTHNKQTMAAVDVIYGVTMQEAGVSKLVPVDFRSLN